MIVNERQTPEGLLVSVCDSDILGETFTDGDVSISVSESFYGGDETDEQGVVASLQRATVANIVGTQAIQVAVENGFVDESTVLTIGETRHAQVLRLG
ncbi:MULTISPECIES: DUF424 domain-containing protein [unclassified Haladaptatus]|uniref:DUF424 domain-containing protein n=1 Tax=unclassified Haladaptatus TaxID=2622732 RepID=UPI0023E7BA17|nr:MULTISPECIES: DUF424 domain-containing protein [unclassified Haladaptatus]